MGVDYEETAKDCPASVASIYTLLDKEDFKGAKRAAMESFVKAVESGNSKEKLFALYALAKTHLLLGEFADAKELVTKKLIAEAADASFKTAVLNLLAKINLALCLYPEAMAAAEEAKASAKNSKRVASEALAECTIAKVQVAEDKKAEAQKTAKQAVELFKSASDSAGEMYALETLMTIFISMKKGDEARRRAEEAVAIYEGSGDDAHEGAAYLMVAQARIGSGGFEEAKEACSKAIDIANVSGDMTKKAKATFMLAVAQTGAEDPEDAHASLNEALEQARAAGSKYAEAQALCKLAGSDIDQGNFEDAIYGAEEGVDLCKKENFKALLAETLTTKATACMARVNSGQSTDSMTNWNARQAGKQALEICREIGDKPGSVKALNVLANAFAEYGNLLEARARARLAVEICQDIKDSKNEGINLLMVAQTRMSDNTAEAARLAKLALTLIKEDGDEALIKDANAVVDELRDYDPKRKDKDQAKEAQSQAQSKKTDYTIDFDYGKTRHLYFDSFIARALRTRG
jgi:tetratricopeptide (TPR) repeat protein